MSAAAAILLAATLAQPVPVPRELGTGVLVDTGRPLGPADRLLAELLLAAPVGVPEDTGRFDACEAVQRLAIEWEVLDDRECRYILANRADWQDDLDFLRRRLIDLADAPPLADAARWPDRRMLDASIAFNRAYKKHLESRLAWEPDRADDIRAVIEETEFLYRVWDAMRDARCEYHYVTVRRAALAKLKTLIGTDAYASGDLPPCVPEWRFQVVR